MQDNDEDDRGTKITIGLEGEVTYIFGGKVGASLSFDTGNLELGARAWVAGTAGLSAGVSVPVSVSRGEVGPAENAVDVKSTVNADISGFLVSTGVELAEFKDGEIIPSSLLDGSASFDGAGGTGEIKLKPALKLGISTGLQVEVEKTSSIIADAVDGVTTGIDIFEDVVEDFNTAFDDLARKAKEQLNPTSPIVTPEYSR